jgi:hypothetical protein
MGSKANEGRHARNGAEMADVATSMREVERTHQATLAFSIVTGGGRFSSAVTVELCATLPRMVAPGRLLKFSLLSEFPSASHKTLDGLLYSLVLQMDYKISREAYRQAPLGLPPEG